MFFVFIVEGHRSRNVTSTTLSWLFLASHLFAIHSVRLLVVWSSWKRGQKPSSFLWFSSWTCASNNNHVRDRSLNSEIWTHLLLLRGACASVFITSDFELPVSTGRVKMCWRRSTWSTFCWRASNSFVRNGRWALSTRSRGFTCSNVALSYILECFAVLSCQRNVSFGLTLLKWVLRGALYTNSPLFSRRKAEVCTKYTVVGCGNRFGCRILCFLLVDETDLARFQSEKLSWFLEHNLWSSTDEVFPSMKNIVQWKHTVASHRKWKAIYFPSGLAEESIVRSVNCCCAPFRGGCKRIWHSASNCFYCANDGFTIPHERMCGSDVPNVRDLAVKQSFGSFPRTLCFTKLH